MSVAFGPGTSETENQGTELHLHVHPVQAATPLPGHSVSIHCPPLEGPPNLDLNRGGTWRSYDVRHC